MNTEKSTSAIDTEKWDTEKWETGIDATVTDIKEVKAFVDWRLSIYKENGWKGFDLWESFVDDFESFTKDILDDLGKDRLKKIRDYLRENRVYVRKEARKSIADGLLGTIHEPTPSKWPTNDSADKPTDDSAGNPTDDSTDDPTDDSADDPTDDSTPALPLPSTAPVRITQAVDQLALQGNFGREITNLAKLYTDEVKYSGEQDNFDFKFEIFQNYCLRAGVPKQAYIIAIPSMLRGLALKYYFTHLKDLNLENVCIGLKSYFEGDEYKRDILSKWNAITLKQVTA